jgi:hypothetical protein
MGAFSVRHELKTWPAEFQAIVSTRKRHEIRANDRDFKAGDELMLREWNPETEQYTGAFLIVDVTYLTKGGTWGLPDHLVVMSIKIQLWNRTGAA